MREQLSSLNRMELAYQIKSYISRFGLSRARFAQLCGIDENEVILALDEEHISAYCLSLIHIYPCINLYLHRQGNPEELICFVEFNPEKERGRNICIGVYQPDVEDTVYYEPYHPEGGLQ